MVRVRRRTEDRFFRLVAKRVGEGYGGGEVFVLLPERDGVVEKMSVTKEGMLKRRLGSGS